MISKEDHEERLELYSRGLNDSQIGEALYLTPGAVAFWRKRNGLKPNFEQKTYDHAEIADMLRSGMSVSEVCKAVGCSNTLVRDIRREVDKDADRG